MKSFSRYLKESSDVATDPQWEDSACVEWVDAVRTAYADGAREMREAAAKECTDLSHTARFIMDGVAMRECAAAIRAIEVEEE